MPTYIKGPPSTKVPTNKQGEVDDCFIPIDLKWDESLSNQSLGACHKPYKLLRRRQ
jgi:hypothetical protein